MIIDKTKNTSVGLIKCVYVLCLLFSLPICQVMGATVSTVDKQVLQQVVSICNNVILSDTTNNSIQKHFIKSQLDAFIDNYEILVDSELVTDATRLTQLFHSSEVAMDHEIRLRSKTGGAYSWFKINSPEGIDIINLPLVEVYTDGKGLAYIRWRLCKTGAVAQVIKELLNVNHELKGVFIDVRGNPGGHLVEAVVFADQWLPKHKEILRLSNSIDDFLEERFSLIFRTRTDKKWDFPVIFITDKHTASTAEAMVAVFKSNKIGISVGQPTKGDALAYSVTDSVDNSTQGTPRISLICVPDFPLYHNRGITPDYFWNGKIRRESLFENAKDYYSALGVGGKNLHTFEEQCCLLVNFVLKGVENKNKQKGKHLCQQITNK